MVASLPPRAHFGDCQAVPPEVRFLEGSLGLNTTTEVRRFALQEFCPQEGISPEDLRFRLRSFMCGMDQLPSKSYHQLQVSGNLCTRDRSRSEPDR